MEEELKNLKSVLKVLNTSIRNLKKCNLEVYQKLLQEPLEDVLNELQLEIEDLESDIKEALEGYYD